ncbi:MAG: DNA polymerase III subunit delta' [Bacteroidales bacterium]
MQFKEIIGQYKIKQQLIKTVKDERISHTQIFLGPQGTGKLALAIAYAQYINCENRQENDSCGICNSCKKYRRLVHPDLHFVYPVKKASQTNPETSDNYAELWRNTILENPYLSPNHWYHKLELENKQGIIPANESHNIIKKLNYKSYESPYKTMIIWLPERMHTSAANKLLKIIEEPPPNTLFFLVSENSDLLLPTILSRTQNIKVPGIDDQSMFNALTDHMGLEVKKAQEIVHLANGSYLDALHYFRTGEEEQNNFKRFVELMRLSYAKKVTDILNWVDEMSSLGRERQKIFLQYAARMVRENFMLNLEMEKITYLTQEEKDFSIKFSQFINNNNAHKIFTEINNASRDIQMNAHNKTLFLDLSIKLMKLLRL